MNKKNTRNAPNGDVYTGWMYSPNVAIVKMEAHDNGTGWLHAGVPGGRPMYSTTSPTEPGVMAMSCSGAPEISTLKDLLDFAEGRFGAR